MRHGRRPKFAHEALISSNEWIRGTIYGALVYGAPGVWDGVAYFRFGWRGGEESNILEGDGDILGIHIYIYI